MSGRLRAQFQRVAARLGSSLRAEELGEGGLDTGKASIICCLLSGMKRWNCQMSVVRWAREPGFSQPCREGLLQPTRLRKMTKLRAKVGKTTPAAPRFHTRPGSPGPQERRQPETCGQQGALAAGGDGFSLGPARSPAAALCFSSPGEAGFGILPALA